MLSFFLLFLSFFLCHNSFSAHSEENLVVCLDPSDVNCVGMLDREFYRHAVERLPICCVDIFVYNPTTKKYFLVFRKDAPAQGIYCVPGGRLYKGESFFACAKRKCFEEAKLMIQPQKILGVFNTLFPDSAWGCQTHTIGIAIFALVEPNSVPELDTHHTDYIWQDIARAPEHQYLKVIYDAAISYLKTVH